MTRGAWSGGPRTRGLKVYLVGGAVRDRLLGRDSTERDFVVVGATPDELRERGFKPAGRDFPVFIHPDSGEEYALARTERKSAPGYRGFHFHAGPDVTLEADLRRRDLTVNAMAEEASGRLIDPFGGRSDLENKTLRHVSEAFAEDPVRLLRLARFSARFPDFTIAPETLDLCRELVENGEVDHLVAERVWQELSRALMEDMPSRFFEVLRSTGALARILPEVDALFGVPQQPEFHPEGDAGTHTLLVVDRAAALATSLEVCFACLVHDLGKALTPKEQLPGHADHEKRGLEPVRNLCERLRVPNACSKLALLVTRWHLHVHRARELRPRTLLKLLAAVDVFRRPERLELLLMACQADWQGRDDPERPYPQGDYLRRAARAAREVDAGKLAARGLEGNALGRALREERLRALQALD